METELQTRAPVVKTCISHESPGLLGKKVKKKSDKKCIDCISPSVGIKNVSSSDFCVRLNQIQTQEPESRIQNPESKPQDLCELIKFNALCTPVNLHGAL